MATSDEKIIHEVIADLRQEQAKQEGKCLEEIKAVRAAHKAPAWFDPQTFVPPTDGLIGKGPGAVAKASVNGNFKGWYREGQTRGLPNRSMPIEKALNKQYEAYYATLRSLVPPKVLASQLGRRSGRSRAVNSLQSAIKLLHQSLLGTSVLKRNRANLIARDLDCSVEYVRRILRQLKNS